MTESGHGFSAQYRLRTAADFRAVFSANRRSVDTCFVVLSRRNGLTVSRLGIRVGKRGIPQAVVRNRLKRIIRESYRVHKSALGGLDLVVISRLRVVPESAVLRSSLARHWKKSIDANCR